MKSIFVFVAVPCSLWLACGHVGAKEMQPWGGAAVQDWTRAAESLVLSDMTVESPASALSLMKLKKGCWKVIPYEMVDGPAGKMVFAPPEAPMPLN